MYNFIPKRKEKIKNSSNLEENKNLNLEALFLKDIDEAIIDNLEKEKILTKDDIFSEEENNISLTPIKGMKKEDEIDKIEKELILKEKVEWVFGFY